MRDYIITLILAWVAIMLVVFTFHEPSIQDVVHEMIHDYLGEGPYEW